MNFTWGFSGDVDRVYWGLRQASADDMASNEILVSLDINGNVLPVLVPTAYIGRVSGIRIGDLSSSRAIFTLSNISKDDEKFYGILLTPSDPFDYMRSDSVYLAAVGGKLIFLIVCHMTPYYNTSHYSALNLIIVHYSMP